MIHWLGKFCILISLGSTLLGLIAAKIGKPRWARRAAYLNFFLMTLASLGMAYALLTNDFSVSYVAQVGALETPRFFAAISLWSSLEGSILLWGWVLSGYTALCLYRYQNQFAELMPQVAIVLFVIGLFFYLVLAIPANPFHSVFPVPENGPGPNPLLQNHWLMALHPPMLYLGYVGMSVPFAFALASLIVGNLESQWVTITRRWFLVAWMFLSAAIILGGWWSYAVLGWGGYWAWDPVENASFMPWLAGTAFLHSIMVEERRQMLKVWNLGLIVITFLLTLLGTFLTRSGILDSVHSFTESQIGHYFLFGIALALVSSVALLIWRGSLLRSPGKLDQPLCRESSFLLNNLLLVCFCFVVLLGTLYPLLVEALRGVKISVGKPFFDQMTVPLALALVLLMGIGVVLPWSKADPKRVMARLRFPILAAVAVSCVVYALGIQKILVLLTVGFAVFSLTIMFWEMAWVAWEKRSIVKLFKENPRRYGGFIVHIGVLVIGLGLAFSGGYQQERQAQIGIGELLDIGSYRVKLVRVYAKHRPHRFELIAEAQVEKKDKVIGSLSPKLNFYPNNREPIGSPAVHATLIDDLYLTLMSFEHETMQTTLRAMVTPAVSWIWLGGGILVIGVLLSVGLQKKTIDHRL